MSIPCHATIEVMVNEIDQSAFIRTKTNNYRFILGKVEAIKLLVTIFFFCKYQLIEALDLLKFWVERWKKKKNRGQGKSLNDSVEKV